jgi:hypothetical protein
MSLTLPVPKILLTGVADNVPHLTSRSQEVCDLNDGPDVGVCLVLTTEVWFILVGKMDLRFSCTASCAEPGSG